ncbi:coatomer protein complex subunit beta 1 [Cricetulus griseus]
MDSEPPSEISLKNDLEKGDVKSKTEALKKVIIMILNGEKLPGLLMTIIRFVLPLQDHTIKKLLLVFWEIVPKTTPDGRLLHEMILVCDAYRKDLQHPNEFIRGSTLRFLCKLKEAELLEPLMPAIRACLEHRHSYVRRNAVLAIYTIYRNFEHLIPDAPELIHDFLVNEKDASCKRNAFMMLIHADQDRALDYLSTCIDQVQTFGDILQLVIVELIYKVCHANPSERARFIRCIYNLLQSSSPAVKYEAAGTLVTLSSAPTAIKAAAQCYIDLIIKESDNNVKLIVLDRLVELKEHPAHERVLQDLVMDILRVLSTPDLEVRKKTLQLALDLVSSRNVEELVIVLKKEVIKTNNVSEHEDTDKYRQLLVRTLHSCSVRFPDMAANVIPVLMEFLSDSNEAAAADVLEFVREAIQRFDNLRMLIVEKMLEVFHAIKSVKIYRGALWILGEYCSTKEDIQSVMTEVRRSLGEIPIVESEIKKEAGELKPEEEITVGPVQKLVTEMGTYATQSALSSSRPTKKEEDRPPLRGFLLDGDFFVAASLATTLTKIALRYVALVQEKKKQNKQRHREPPRAVPHWAPLGSPCFAPSPPSPRTADTDNCRHGEGPIGVPVLRADMLDRRIDTANRRHTENHQGLHPRGPHRGPGASRHHRGPPTLTTADTANRRHGEPPRASRERAPSGSRRFAPSPRTADTDNCRHGEGPIGVPVLRADMLDRRIETANRRHGEGRIGVPGASRHHRGPPTLTTADTERARLGSPCFAPTCWTGASKPPTADTERAVLGSPVLRAITEDRRH